ncbi:protein of unknown function [Pseudomonas asturiensis]|uniref:YjiS-like domain-containing protein n=1 Tax=Pseudomonas asturiensis TaxID=1190415 RepID=A0A1M7PZA7_9PSED|nr:DUF1127 domain-containing protein [Pseudomonas asturiensis]SHN23082.1 protein of unknown function [Pseudomonas asturiensis]
MNGLSDVRLMLHSQELDNTLSTAIKAVHADQSEAPAGMGRWARYRHRWTTRRTLLQMTDDELRDVGLDAWQARAEAMKPFWR